MDAVQVLSVVGELSVQDVLDRLTRIEQQFVGSSDDMCREIAALKLDIEIHCRRNGVPFTA